MSSSSNTGYDVTAEVAQLRARRTLLENTWLLLKSAPPTAIFGMIVIVFYALVALFAPMIAPFGEPQIVGSPYEPWSSKYLLGTDQLGRDMFSRVVYGARNTIGIAILTTILSFLIGTTLGTMAAYARGWMDQLLSRSVDVLMAIPNLIFALMLLAVFGSTIGNLVLIIAVLESTRVFRLARAVALSVVVMDYVEYAQLRGEGLYWMLRREVTPNIAPPLVAEFGLRFTFVFLQIASLSFLGVGIQPPTADWGSMVRESSTLISYGDITPLIPAAAIGLLTIGVNFVVDWFIHKSSGLRD